MTQSEYLPRYVSAKSYSCSAWLRSSAEYAGSSCANTIEAEAIAAAVSAATSLPGQDASTLAAGRSMVMTSAGPHHLWSASPSPTCTYSSFGAVCALMR